MADRSPILLMWQRNLVSYFRIGNSLYSVKIINLFVLLRYFRLYLMHVSSQTGMEYIARKNPSVLAGRLNTRPLAENAK